MFPSSSSPTTPTQTPSARQRAGRRAGIAALAVIALVGSAAAWQRSSSPTDTAMAATDAAWGSADAAWALSPASVEQTTTAPASDLPTPDAPPIDTETATSPSSGSRSTPRGAATGASASFAAQGGVSVTGMPVAQARAQASGSGMTVRVVQKDGEELMYSRDYEANRLNVAVNSGVVVSVLFVG